MSSGGDYDRHLQVLAASGVDARGEATFVSSAPPASVLDASCGTSRVAIDLARRGIEVVGVDIDATMLDAAGRTAAGVRVGARGCAWMRR